MGTIARRRCAAAGVIVAVILTLAACSTPAGYLSPHAQQLTVRPSIAGSGAGTSGAGTSAAPSGDAAAATEQPKPPAVVLGTVGTFQVGQRKLTFTEPAHPGPSGAAVAPRTLVVRFWYPTGPSARGPFPLLLFAPGFQQCASSYGDMLTGWASAGYVVAGINFPHSNCHVGKAATEKDMINQPGDMSYVLKRLLAMNKQPGDVFSGLLDSHEVAAAGQSDGGDTVAALAANTCCTDRRFTAVAVLSGAEWPPMPGRYFAASTPPMLFVQGSSDIINPPSTSKQLYDSDDNAARYYLNLFGADHLGPYQGTNDVERIVVRVTVAFFDRYVLGQQAALSVMTKDGNVRGAAALVAGGTPVPSG